MTAMCITVPDTGTNPTFSASLGIDGADAAVVVDVNQWATLAALTTALNALSTSAQSAVAVHRSIGPARLRPRSEPGAFGQRELGPWDSGAWAVGGANMRFFPARSGWNATLVAAAEKQGPAIGPVGAAIITNADAPGYAASITAAVAGALQGLVGRLP